MSDKIKPQHVERKAILYIRQSSAYQVTHNLESQRSSRPYHLLILAENGPLSLTARVARKHYFQKHSWWSGLGAAGPAIQGTALRYS